MKRSTTLFLLLSVTLLSGCLTDSYFSPYDDVFLHLPPTENAVARKAPEGMGVVALQEFEDLRGKGSSDSSALVYLPLVLYATQTSERIEEDWFPQYFRFDGNSAAAALTTAAAKSLERAGLFGTIVRKGRNDSLAPSVSVAGDAAMSATLEQLRKDVLPKYDLLLTGKIHRMYVERVGYPCGLSFLSVYLWVPGFPIESVCCELDIELTATNRNGDVVWTWRPDVQQQRMKRLGGLYYVSRSLFVPSKQACAEMDLAMADLAAAMKAGPKRFGRE